MNLEILSLIIELVSEVLSTRVIPLQAKEEQDNSRKIIT